MNDVLKHKLGPCLSERGYTYFDPDFQPFSSQVLKSILVELSKLEAQAEQSRFIAMTQMGMSRSHQLRKSNLMEPSFRKEEVEL